jgi:RHS repeat-associated protein
MGAAKRTTDWREFSDPTSNGSDYRLATYVSPPRRSFPVKGAQPRVMSMATTNTPSSTPIAVYLWAGNQIVRNVTTGNFYFHDGRGNVSHLVNSSNTVVQHYTYFVSGQPTSWMSGPSNRFLFQGALYEPEPQIYDMRNRFYHPNLGRFMQSDPTGFDAGDMNLFRYCGNDPVNRSDPSGLHDLGDDAEAAAWNARARGTEYGFDVRYGINDDLLGWEAAEYIREGMARNDAASQQFAEYSSALAERSAIRAQLISLGIVFKGPRVSEVDPHQPIGYEVFGDAELYAALDKAHLDARKLPPPDHIVDWFKAMKSLDTGFFKNVCYYYSGNIGNMGGYWSGYEINYIGVGEGFAAGGYSVSAMNRWITAYNYSMGYTYPMLEGKKDWAKVGYDDYVSRH